MSTITKESIADTIEGLEHLANSGIQSVYIDMAIAGMRRLLASLEAEAVPEWTNEQCMEFLSIAFRHAEINGDLQLDDIRLGVKMVNGSRAAMLQGAEPVTSAYKLPANTPCKDAPEQIWLQTAGVWPENGEFSELTWCSDNQHKDDTLYVRADVVTGNSPVIPDGWVACSERMPEAVRNLALYGQSIDSKGEPYGDPRVDEGYLALNGKFYFFDWERPGVIGDIYDGVEATVTHWMYWELPVAPQQEVK